MDDFEFSYIGESEIKKSPILIKTIPMKTLNPAALV